jgi:hypothetical protein
VHGVSRGSKTQLGGGDTKVPTLNVGGTLEIRTIWAQKLGGLDEGIGATKHCRPLVKERVAVQNCKLG